jgi:hypothetical protein
MKYSPPKKQTLIASVHRLCLKNHLPAMDTRHRASLEARRAVSLSLSHFLVTEPPRGRPVGGGGTHHIGQTHGYQFSYHTEFYNFQTEILKKTERSPKNVTAPSQEYVIIALERRIDFGQNSQKSSPFSYQYFTSLYQAG